MRVYLDHNATAPLLPEVLGALQHALRDSYGNPSSVHWAGALAREQLEHGRQQVADALGVAPQTLIFTSGATEANHTCVHGALRHAPPDRDELVTTAIEHSSLLGPCRELAQRGVRVHEVAAHPDGRVDTAAFASALGPRTRLASVMWVNNETGVIQPVRELAERAHEHGALFHSDATQALGRLPLDLAAEPIDLASFSAHKLGGPKGVGALYVREGVQLEPLLLGGDQERGLRAGTENVAGVVGFGTACAIASRDLAACRERVEALRRQLWEGIAKQVPDVRLHGSESLRVPHVLHVSFAGVDGEALVQALDLSGIAAASGSACHAGSTEPSHVLLAMGVPPDLCRGALRLSLGPGTTREEIEYVLEILPEAVARVRRAGARGVAR